MAWWKLWVLKAGFFKNNAHKNVWGICLSEFRFKRDGGSCPVFLWKCFFYEFHKSAKRSHFENAISYYTKRGVVHIKTPINLLAFYNTVRYRPRPRASVKLQIFESVLKKNIFNKTRQIIFLARRPPKRHKYDEYTFFKKKIPGITMKATTKVHFLNQIIIL